MKHLKLVRGLSYVGRGVTATKAAPNVTVMNDDRADELIATGYFEEDKLAKGTEFDPNQTSLLRARVSPTRTTARRATPARPSRAARSRRSIPWG